jgi:hypothetical protein
MTTTRDTRCFAPDCHTGSGNPRPCLLPSRTAIGRITPPGTAAPRAMSQVAECSDAIWSTSAAQHQTLTPQALDRSAHPKDPAIKINVVPRKGQ